MTAVEFLLGQFALLGLDVLEYKTIIEQAIAIEKQQIKTAYLAGNSFGIDVDNNLSPSQYYNETFKSE